MPQFAANLTMMFTEHPFLDRFDAAAEAGFEHVEFLFPYEHPAEQIEARLRRNGLTQALFNLPPGDWAAGDRGLAVFPERVKELRDGLERALPYIEATGVKRVHLMAGVASASAATDATYREAVRWCADRLADQGVDLLLEPLNVRDNPGYYLTDFDRAADLIRLLALPNVKLQFDLYHCQIIHGDVTKRLQALMSLTGHVQIASVPSRHEPDDEELNYPFLLAELDRLGYGGYVGCEYRPRGRTRDGLDWFAPYRRKAGVAAQ
jgi:hydroxypyruvate isomerase